jgi:hypothetical protein
LPLLRVFPKPRALNERNEVIEKPLFSERFFVPLFCRTAEVRIKRYDVARNSDGTAEVHSFGAAKGQRLALLPHLHSPESRSLIYWRMPGLYK